MISSRRRAALFALVAIAVWARVGLAFAQQSVEPFYRGRTVTILVGANSGGGYDAYARLIGHRLGRYIPGNPTIVYSYMPGAGGAAAISYINNVAQRDGTVINAAVGPALLDPLLVAGSTSRFDPLRQNYVGSAAAEVAACLVRSDAAVKSFADVFSTELILGSTGGSTHDLPTALKNVLGAKIRLINGYPGSRELLLAIEKDETQGLCGVGFTSIVSQHPEYARPGGPMRFLVQETLAREPALDSLGVPRAIDFARTEEQKQILSVVYAHLEFTRPFLMAPDAPAERVAALRLAFDRAVADPETGEEAASQSLVLSPMRGEELGARIRALYSLPHEIIDKARQATAD